MRLFAIVLLLAGAAASAYWVTFNASTQTLHANAVDELTLSRQALLTQIERFKRLPPVIGMDERVRALAAGAADEGTVALASEYLREVGLESGAAQVFVLDADGSTIASSNPSLMGQNYRFRPYFRDALASGRGQFYAVGATTGEPGYFLAARIDDTAGRQAVVVVKVDFAALAETWRQASAGSILLDQFGLVLLAGDPSLLYRKSRPLTESELIEIRETRKYGSGFDDTRPLILDGVLSQGQADMERAPILAGGSLVSVLPVGQDGWRLVVSTSIRSVQLLAVLVSALAGALFVVLWGAVALVIQRRRLVAFKLAQHGELERKVDARTRALADEIEERKAVETALRATQGELVEAAKLAALGQMSAAIVHEVSQPLAAMETQLASAGLYAERGDSLRAVGKLAAARDTIARMQRMVRHLKTFARRDTEPAGSIAAVDAKMAIAEAIELVEPRRKDIGGQIEFDGSGSARVMAGSVRLQQILVNLLVNALDALAEAPDRRVTVSLNQEDGVVAILVRDRGHGLNGQDGDALMAPFVSRKGSQGLGLGLSISRALAESFGGTLTLSDHPEGGAVARLVLRAAHVTGSSGQSDKQLADAPV